MFAIPRLTPFVKGLLIALIAIYVGVAVVDVWVLTPSEDAGSRTLFGWLALTPGDLGIHTLWQIATYPWVEPPIPQAVIGFLIGLLFVWWMLSPFEERFGAHWVAKLCASATIAGALPAILA